MRNDAPVPVSTGEDPRFVRLEAYLKANIAALDGPLRFLQFPGGFSNMTYLVAAKDVELVLKAAPPGKKAKAAHNVGREFQIMEKLFGRYPYLPRPVLYCEDLEVFDEPFCVMERLSGIVFRTYDRQVDQATPPKHFERLIEAVADLHAVDYIEAGLSEFGRPQGYRRRQIEGWQSRLSAARTDDMADFTAVAGWLSQHEFADPETAAVVHNDFKLDNLMWDEADPTRLIAVLDWEMATLGDPLLDLAYTLSFWIEKDDPPEFQILRGMPSTAPGVFSRREAVARYEKLTRRAMNDFDALLCFAFLRRAAIEQQKYVRYRRGESSDPRFANLNEAVRVLRDMCLRTMDQPTGA